MIERDDNLGSRNDTSRSDDADTTDDLVTFTEPKRLSETLFDRSGHSLRVAFGAATHTGNVRRNNEDHYAIVKRNRSVELILTNLEPADLTLANDSDYAMVVADGMGGRRCGELASRLAMQRLFELAQQATSWVMKLTDLDALQIRERVEAYVCEIQATLRAHQADHPERAGMGTTLTLAQVVPPHAVVVQIGDSRAYLLHGGQLRQITRDETLAQAFIDSGMSPEGVSRFRHLLTNNLGGEWAEVNAQVHHVPLGPKDQLLLCSDGLHDMVPDEKITSILNESVTPQSACDHLIAAALASGGKDNVTVTLASVS